MSASEEWLNRFFDFSDPGLSREPFPFLGPDAGHAVLLARDALAQDPADRGAQGAACLAAARTLSKLAALSQTPTAYEPALSAICEALEQAARFLKAKQAKKTGPKRNARDLEFQGRAVIAVGWLQRLAHGAMTRDDAVAAVAEEIPARMLAARGRNYRGDTRLNAWTEAFSDARVLRNRDHQRVLRKLQHEIWETWFATWREPIVDRNGKPRRDAEGMIVYGQEQTHGSGDVSPADVLSWLRGKSAAAH